MTFRLPFVPALTRRHFLKHTGIDLIATEVANVSLNLDAAKMKR